MILLSSYFCEYVLCNIYAIADNLLFSDHYACFLFIPKSSIISFYYKNIH